MSSRFRYNDVVSGSQTPRCSLTLAPSDTAAAAEGRSPSKHALNSRSTADDCEVDDINSHTSGGAGTLCRHCHRQFDTTQQNDDSIRPKSVELVNATFTPPPLASPSTDSAAITVNTN